MEIISKTDRITVDKRQMLAALECVSDDVKGSPAICGIHIHAHEGDLRIVGTSGPRMLIGSTPLPKEPKPAKWLSDGMTLATEGLKKRLGLIDGDVVCIDWSPGNVKAVLSDPAGNDTFRLPVIEAAFPDYIQLIGDRNFDGTMASEPVGFNSVHLKSVADLANVFKDLLPEDVKKDKTGMPIRVYSSGPEDPVWFTFGYVPGVVLWQIPVSTAAKIAPESARLMAPAMRGSLAALKANRTRTEVWAKDAKTDDERDMYLEKIQGYNARIDAMMASMSTALPAPKPAEPPKGPVIDVKPVAEPQPEAPAAKPNAEAPKPKQPAPRNFNRGSKHSRPNATGRNA